MKKHIYLVACYISIIMVALFAAHGISRSITVISEMEPVKWKHCVIVDPGHGGEDGGAISLTGSLESSYNLQISQRLNDLFHLLGYNSKMTRTKDISIYRKGETLAQKKISDLKERVRIVNNTENGLLLSIHQNHFPDKRYRGAQIFYADTAGSKELATLMQTGFLSALNPESNRKCKKSEGVYIMEHITKPGILIECGFISNSEEEQLLKTQEYQKKL